METTREKKNRQSRESYHRTGGNTDKRRKARSKLELMTLYGITPEQRDLMVEEQNNLCLICDSDMASPCVDHCHTTGKVRGMLCRPCNLLLGQSHDSIPKLERCIQYLRRAQ